MRQGIVRGVGWLLMTQEPLWWQQAREMRSQNKSLGTIARILKKDHTTVLYAVDVEFREKRRAQNLERGRTRKYKQKFKDYARGQIVAAARQEAEATGQHIDLVLIAWGTTPRRARC